MRRVKTCEHGERASPKYFREELVHLAAGAVLVLACLVVVLVAEEVVPEQWIG